MPLLVVPLAPEGVGELTLAEWDALRACSHVYFELPHHPLARRLTEAGVACGPFDDELSGADDGWGLVVDPASTRVVELARSGANVTAGTAAPPDALTAAHGAPIARRAAASLATLAVVMARLRSADGCPWDREQTHESLEVHLLEEAYEVLESIDQGDSAGLREELGDLLLQVAFHARIAEQEGSFDLAGVADAIVAKLLHRHPHVFGEATVADAAEVVRNWESIKRAEKRRAGVFEDMPTALPALLSAHKTQKRAAQLGFTVSEDQARQRLREALRSGAIGDALFWLVAVARAKGVDPETALRRAVAAFRATMLD